MFIGGLTRLVERAQQNRERLGSRATEEQLAFYEAVEIVYAATIALTMRFSKLAQKMIGDYPEHESHLRAIAGACRRVLGHSAV